MSDKKYYAISDERFNELRKESEEAKKEILKLQRELNHLDTIKEEKLSGSSLFIHSIKFGGNRIVYRGRKNTLHKR